MHVHLYYDDEGSLDPTSTLAYLAQDACGGNDKDVKYCLAVYMDKSEPDGHIVMRAPEDSVDVGRMLYNDVVYSRGNHTFVQEKR